MDKKKVFSGIMSVFLVFSSGSMQVFANTIIDGSSSDKKSDIYVEKNETENEEIREVLNSLIFLVNDNDHLIVNGKALNTYDLKISTGENSYFFHSKEELELILSKNEVEDYFVFTFLKEDKIIEEHTLEYLDSKNDLEMIEDEKSFEYSAEKFEEGNDLSTEINEESERNDNIKEEAELEYYQDPKEIIDESEIQQFQSFNSSLNSTRNHVNGIYTVVSEDTFFSIAQSFNLTQSQLFQWNGHISNVNNLPIGARLAVTRQGVENMLSDADKRLLHSGDNPSQFNNVAEFIDYFAPLAIEISSQEGEESLWASLMLAQAIHESGVARNQGMSQLSRPPYHNLSGLKASTNQPSVLMWTWESIADRFNENPQNDNINVDVLDHFRTFPSYRDSLQAYANLLRYGRGTGEDFYYRGTWRRNTNSVWDVLDNGGLRGYATDPAYFNAIRNTINTYNLTQYDLGNFQVRTGTFLGETFTQQQADALNRLYPQYTYEVRQDLNATPYSYRRIQSTNEFLGEAGAQRAINRLKEERGWHATMQPTGNSTPRYRVQSGFFNSRGEIDRAVSLFRDRYGLHASVVRGTDGKYRMQTGFFNGREAAQVAIDFMAEMNWWSQAITTGDSTPHYIIRTGEFNTPASVNSAINYFARQNWGAEELLTSRNNYYYRIFVSGFGNQSQAQNYVNTLKSRHNWHSVALSLE